MMCTAAQITRIKKIQGVFSILALLNFSGFKYSKDANFRDGSTYDYIVVGGGSAGVVVAARLAEANFKTLIVEAGENPSLENWYPGLVTYIKNSRLDWNFTSQCDGFTGQCRQASGLLFGKVLGGSGATNSMIYGRGNPRSFEKFYEATNDPSWKWENMLKYFKKSENLQDKNVLKSAYGKYHSNKGTLGVTKENRPVCDEYLQGFEQAGEAVVVDNVGAGIIGYSSALYHILDGVRSEGASTYLPPLKDNPNLHITRGSLVTKIIFDDKKNAVGVEFVRKGKTITVKARKEVIVAAGPIKSPQLLMLSGVGPRKELEKLKIKVLSNIPVGKNLHNDVGTLLAFRTNRRGNPEPFNAHHYRTPLITGYSALNKSSCYPDYETLNYIIDDSADFLSFCGFTLGFKNSICDRLGLLAGKNQMLVTIILNINTKSRGEIVLNSTDPFVQPKIINRYFTNKDDLDALVDYIIDYVKIEGTPFFQCLGLECMKAAKNCDKYTFGSKAYWRCYVLCMTATTAQRYCGTCSMGSVVDSQLKVKGVNRLRVVDASVMPNTVGTAIYASVVALAEKAAEIIIRSNRL